MNRFFIILITTLLLIMSCDNNKLILVENVYPKSGSIMEKYYVDDNGLQQSVYTSFYDISGQIKENGTILNGKFQGKYTVFYETGSIKAESFLKNNIEVDTTFYYEVDGNIESYSIYDSLGRHLKDVFYSNGNVKNMRAFFVGDNVKGRIAMHKELYPDGSVNIDKSNFCIIEKVNNNSIRIKLLSNIHDSVSVNFVKDFDYKFSFEADVIRTIRLGNVKEFVVEFRDEDFVNDTINIQIIKEFWENGKLTRQGGNDLQFSEQIDIASDYISPIYR